MARSVSVLVRFQDADAVAERSVVVGFLARYTGSTRVGYITDLRLFAAWCAGNGVRPLDVKRATLELFARHMESEGLMRSTVARRLCTLGSLYRYCHVEGVLSRNPAANVRRPKVDHESRALGLDRNELGALLVQAGIGSARGHALVSLLALNGLRISEALNADIDDLDIERGHRTLRIVSKGGKPVTIRLAPRTATAIDLYIGERTVGPIFVSATGQRMNRHDADRTVKRLARRAGIGKRILPHSLRHSFITAALDAGSRFATFKWRLPTPIPERRCATTAAAKASIVTPPTLSPPSSPAPHARHDQRSSGGTDAGIARPAGCPHP